MRIFKLKNTIQEYAWGSKTIIPELLGKTSPAEKPQAELWMGAHPKAPSVILQDGKEISLANHIKQDPKGILGQEVAEIFDDKLPFLFKVLAAETPLSIQAHPNLLQAKEGYKRENEQSIPVDSTRRNYKDANHKPELICALTTFDAMCGFRNYSEMCDLFQFLQLQKNIPEIETFIQNPTGRSLQILFKELMELSEKRKKEAVDLLLERCKKITPRTDEERFIFQWINKLSQIYPGDIGIFAPLLLNTIRLQPGQALYLDAGILHAYLKGAGIEIMANSDNVLRGGLTPKHIDVPELMKTLSFSAKPLEIIEPVSFDDVEFIYDTPAYEFRLSIIKLTESIKFYNAKKRSGAEIILCRTGFAEIEWDREEKLTLKKGESIFIPFSAGKYKIEGKAVLYRATIPVPGTKKK
ncbi:MAG: mannose-6-phosphate isomerase, class I [Candidatus Cloacimonetes bacterium]|nr:mannose-6-phosphate isomerase, class I [Candidatus Cloacimonadota bacterium]